MFVKPFSEFSLVSYKYFQPLLVIFKQRKYKFRDSQESIYISNCLEFEINMGSHVLVVE